LVVAIAKLTMNTFISPWAENTRLGVDRPEDSYNRNAETEYRQIDSHKNHKTLSELHNKSHNY